MDEKNNIKKSDIENSEAEKENFIKDTIAESDNTEKLVEERKKKFIYFLKNKQTWVIIVLIIAVILGVYIRSMPMQDHGGKPGLWDITTNTWTLGPDLDPWLFTRYAEEIVEHGFLPKMDMIRNVPLGFDTSIETKLLPYMIAGTYYVLNIFGESSALYAAIIFPVIMFGLTIIVFFLFVREIFIRKSKEETTKANIIASISTFFMIVTPAFLSRTVAGIPEKESAGFFFMFLAFYLFLKAWDSEKIKNAVILAVLSGAATALMGLVWGGVLYIYITISITTLIAFILNKVRKKEKIVFFGWILTAPFLSIIFSNKYTIMGFLTGLDTGLASILLFVMLIDFILWDTKLSNNKYLNRIKLPKNITSIIISLVLLLLLSLILFGPSFIFDKLKLINQIMFKPVTGRWSITVAENRQPYFVEWAGSFGPFVKNIPILFWLFFAGSVVLFKNMLSKIKQKDSWILTALYVLFFFGLVFSRYSGSSTLNGENLISKSVYYGSVLLLIGFLIYYYMKYYKEGDGGFERIDFEFLFLFALFVFCLFTARSAVRLIMVLAPVAPIFVGFLIVESITKFRETKDETFKILLGIVIIIILISSIFTFWTFYKSVKGQAYSFIPSGYNQQWQKAMQWVREETPKDAVFSHWWDYGYWVQSIGNRATVLDGGNVIVYWNYLIGRLVLTGDNQNDALEFLYNHNATHLLIDSTDIGKYTAFSSIGSNKDYDRYSWIVVFLLDEKQIQETKNQTVLVYVGGVGLDEDLIINENEKEILLPGQKAGVGAIILPLEKVEGGEKFGQPYIIAVYQGKQYKVNLRYLSVGGKFIDFSSGIEAAAYIFPRLIQQEQGVVQNPTGAVMFISPRLMRGMLSQVYILNDPLNNFPNFKLVHSEQSLIVDSLNQQGMNLPEFVYYEGVQGPIKIWEIEYSGNEKIKQEYIDTDHSKYLDWKL